MNPRPLSPPTATPLRVATLGLLLAAATAARAQTFTGLQNELRGSTAPGQRVLLLQDDASGGFATLDWFSPASGQLVNGGSFRVEDLRTGPAFEAARVQIRNGGGGNGFQNDGSFFVADRTSGFGFNASGFVNNGTFSLGSNFVDVENPRTLVNLFDARNTGAFTIGEGSTVRSVDGFTQAGGTLSVAGDLDVRDFTFSGGTIVGPLSFFETAVRIDATATGSALFEFRRGNNELRGSLVAGQTVTLAPSGFANLAWFSPPGGPVVNEGTLSVRSRTTGNTGFATMNILDERNGLARTALQNDGTFEVEEGFSGFRLGATGLVNNGTFTLGRNRDGSQDVLNLGEVRNTGSLSIGGGRVVEAPAGFTQTAGTTTIGGILRSSTVAVTGPSVLTLDAERSFEVAVDLGFGRTLTLGSDATLSGNGAVRGNVSASGEIDPGDAVPGQAGPGFPLTGLEIYGDLSFGVGGRLLLDTRGLPLSDSELFVGGLLDLTNLQLELRLAEDLTFEAGDTLAVIRANSVTGDLAGLRLRVEDGLARDFQDYVVETRNGQVLIRTTAAVVPEPATGLALALVLGVAATRRRPRRPAAA